MGLGERRKGANDTHSRPYLRDPMVSATAEGDTSALSLPLPNRHCNSHQLWTRKGSGGAVDHKVDRDEKKGL